MSMTTERPTERASAFPLGVGIGLLGHAIAWIAYWALGQADDHPAIPAWGALVLAFSGREGILAVFSLAAMIPLHAGTHELETEGRPVLARVWGALFAALALALAWRWFTQERLVFASIAALLAVPWLVEGAPKDMAKETGSLRASEPGRGLGPPV